MDSPAASTASLPRGRSARGVFRLAFRRQIVVAVLTVAGYVTHMLLDGGLDSEAGRAAVGLAALCLVPVACGWSFRSYRFGALVVAVILSSFVAQTIELGSFFLVPAGVVAWLTLAPRWARSAA